MTRNKYSEVEIDVLKEITNIGGGNAATSISELVGQKIDMTVPVIEILSYDELYSQVMEEEEVVDASLISVTGDGGGVFLYIIEEEYKNPLAKMMAPGLKEIDDALENSALSELSNIIVSSFVTAVVQLLNINLNSSVPMISQDMFAAILSSVYIEQNQVDSQIMIIKNEFIYEGEKIESALYFVPGPGALEKLFNKLGI